MELISFTHSDYYNTGTVTVNHNGREFTISAYKGVHPEYRYAKRDDVILTQEQADHNSRLHNATFFMESDYFQWDDEKQMYISGDYETATAGNIIATEDSQYITEDEYNSWCFECVNNNLDFEDYIDKIIDKEQADVVFKLRFGSLLILKEGFLSRLRQKYINDEVYDIETLISERSGNDHERVLALHGNHAVILEDEKYELWYVNNNEAELVTSFKQYDTAIEYLDKELSPV